MKTKAALLIVPVFLFLLVWGMGLWWPAYRFSAQAFEFPGEGYFNAVNPGLVQEGSRVYGQLGCAECHTQHVTGQEIWKDSWFSSARDREFPVKQRVTLPDDYMGEFSAHLGHVSYAPDLSNLSERINNRLLLEGEKGEILRFGTPAQWLYLHLYNPRDPVFRQEWSVCPALPDLFEVKPVRGQGSDSLALPVNVAQGRQVVPGAKARILVSYLLGLSKNSPMTMDMIAARRSLLPRDGKSFYLPQTSGKVLSEKEVMLKEGARVFSMQCSVCHGHDGTGDGFNYPPLAGSEFLTKLPVEDLIDIVLRGVRGPLIVKGRQWDNYMTPLGDRLTDQEIAAVLTYATGQFSGKEREGLTEAAVKRRREVVKGLPPIPAQELLEKMSKNE